MRWEMEEVEAVLERIWDLHDKISDAIHAISRAHFLESVRAADKPFREKAGGKTDPAAGAAKDGRDGRNGFVFVKDFRAGEVDDDAAMAEAKSLNAIRTALENLEDQLEFFHTVQSQQRAERDAAIARLEQSRIILAMRLADHQGKKYRVIEEALAFVGDVHDVNRFVSQENGYSVPRSQSGQMVKDDKGQSLSVFTRMLLSSLALARNSFRLESIGGVLGNAAVFAVSMLALLQLHQVSFRSETPIVQGQSFYQRKDAKGTSYLESSPRNNKMKNLDVLLARG
ncbi:plastid division protein PDV1-like [Typha angustifolia]|uniref:plastid division protein PDV1-like n=1 Tax=Typha angustifolia TaxID=59011 RepID=UPI003C2FBA87